MTRRDFDPKNPVISRAFALAQLVRFGSGQLPSCHTFAPSWTSKYLWECEVRLDSALEEYEGPLAAWLDAAKKEVAAVQKLQKAIALGSLRDIEKLRQSARAACETSAQRAQACEPLEFDARAYLSNGDFLAEISEAAAKAGAKLRERDGVIFCYPVLLRPEPELSAVRIDKALEANLRPPVLAARLAKLQAREPKSRPDKFLETLLAAYELVRASRDLKEYIDLPLTAIYEVLTLLPGSGNDYTLLDFTRDIYMLDASDIEETKKGFRFSLPASTVSRERSAKILFFVTRDGYEKQYAALKFTPPADSKSNGENR